MRRSTATTLQDVAREVGVATITASVVLNGSRSATRVSDATRARIIEAATRLNYRPNAVARGLTRRRMDTVGVVGRFVDQEINIYFLEVLSGILEGSAKHNQNTTVISVTDFDKEQNKILQFCDGRIDGLILIGPTSMTESFVDQLHSYSPYVTLHAEPIFSSIDRIDVDNIAGSRLVVSHLIENGHRRIAYFSGDLKLEGPELRLAGYRQALEDANIAYDPSLVIYGGFDAASGIASVDALLERFPPGSRPTAIACVNDTTACAAIERLAARNFRVPEDFSIVGFDDTAVAKMSSPPLTTVRQPLHQMGLFAVERLLFRIEEALSGVKQHGSESLIDSNGTVTAANTLADAHLEIFPVTLIVRGSTAPIPSGS